jgi:hypothetical protein
VDRGIGRALGRSPSLRHSPRQRGPALPHRVLTPWGVRAQAATCPGRPEGRASPQDCSQGSWHGARELQRPSWPRSPPAYFPRLPAETILRQLVRANLGLFSPTPVRTTTAACLWDSYAFTHRLARPRFGRFRRSAPGSAAPQPPGSGAHAVGIHVGEVNVAGRESLRRGESRHGDGFLVASLVSTTCVAFGAATCSETR